MGVVSSEYTVTQFVFEFSFLLGKMTGEKVVQKYDTFLGSTYGGKRRIAESFCSSQKYRNIGDEKSNGPAERVEYHSEFEF